jgi:hypothetical protein
MKINLKSTVFICRILLPVVTGVLLLASSRVSFAQTGGHAYQFLETANSARIAAIGGIASANDDDDLNFSFHNPALLNNNMHITLS